MTRLQRDYDAVTAELSELAAAIVAAENDAATARVETDELTDADGVLAAMAEERAARNRVTLLRRRQAEAQRERARLSVELERERRRLNDALATQAFGDAGAAVVEVYRQICETRDAIYAAQCEAGQYPVDSPLDRLCADLESAIKCCGGVVVPDTSRSVSVRWRDFEYVRRPIGFTPPTPTPRRAKNLPMSELDTLAARLKNRRAEGW